MKKRTDNEISGEIQKLKSLRPIGAFSRKTADTIQVQIDALSGDIDDTAHEFSELTEDHQMAATDALNWMRGNVESKPSSGWNTLCA